MLKTNNHIYIYIYAEQFKKGGQGLNLCSSFHATPSMTRREVVKSEVIAL